jgi:hypothetical protein
MDADLRHAYAVLGVWPPVTRPRLKRRYKALVRRWHPDRYHSDPAGQAEATQRLRDINIAYQLVAASMRLAEAPQSPARRVPTGPPFSWSRDRVDAIVDSMNRMNRLSPEMSVQRWVSIAVVVVYVVAGLIVIPTYTALAPGVVFVTLGYLSLTPSWLMPPMIMEPPSGSSVELWPVTESWRGPVMRGVLASRSSWLK